ncbi:MAG: dTDP-4-dehydrorhamnose reductase, partial [Candidatus Niameybacter stercoravium]|nr:dTDP-4-dehydrorhamnose reductase [Candidatus Niameybacter stercoravium]
AYRVNALGAQNLAIICDIFDIKLVHISTDYIFDGKHEVPYIEGDQVNPQNVYGKSKLAGEEAVRRLCKKHFILRTAWLYGEGNNFVRTMLKLAKTNQEINVVGDQYGTPTYTKDLVAVIINLMQTEYYGTYHATCEGMCSWYDFALEIFKLKEIDVKVNKVTSEEFVRPAKRPKYSVLDNANLKKLGMNTFRPWQEALEEYLEIDAAWQEEHLGDKANG